MDILKDVIINNPWWVYAIFALVIPIGIFSLKTRISSLKRMFILPFIFIAWSIYTLATTSKHYMYVITWIGFLVFGSYIGWKLVQVRKIKADKRKMLVTIPGGPTTLIFATMIFATKYFFGYLYTTHPLAQKDIFIYTADVVTSGLICGILLGKAICFLYKFTYTEHTHLSKKNLD